jgi:DNA repair ATPase RecN
MTGAGKSVIIADLLAQIGHRFGFRLIVEEGLSHAVLTQTQGCEPVIGLLYSTNVRFSVGSPFS